jgi:hypothetical protein
MASGGLDKACDGQVGFVTVSLTGSPRVWK